MSAEEREQFKAQWSMLAEVPCPHCGQQTPRRRAECLHCGQSLPLTAEMYLWQIQP